MISGIVLAAGKSERMGQPKMILPWGDTTVVGQVITTLVDAGLGEVVVVTGSGRENIAQALSPLPHNWPVRLVFNPHFAAGEMLSSLQAGIAALDESVEAALLALGDQPQIESRVVRAVLDAYRESDLRLVVPSYQMRRGHPMLFHHSLWPDILALHPPHTLRDLLVSHHDQIHYVTVDTPTILQDMDTPADYSKYRP
jgi:molybdenum cofactor cytidylyltransferase